MGGADCLGESSKVSRSGGRGKGESQGQGRLGQVQLLTK